jgi:hypothetical protein
MRSLGTFWLVVVSLSVPVWGDEFPWSGTVVENNVTARSGPTYGSYPTERLPRGTVVEVHRAVADGWLAIRPPEEAFDWVPEHAVQRDAEDPSLATVTEEFPVFIGSNVKRVEQHLSQVTLVAGDVVAILGEKGTDSAAAGRWYKIKPPAGEFRWVQAKFLRRQSPEDLKRADDQRLAEREARYRDENEQAREDLESEKIAERARSLAAKRETRTSSAGARRSIDTIEERVADRQLQREPEGGRDRNADGLGTALSSSVPPVRTQGLPRYADEVAPPRTRISLAPEETGNEESDSVVRAAREQVLAARSQEFREQLTSLEADLTSMVAQEPALWRLSTLRQRAELLVGQGPSALERGQARLILEKIAQFEATLPPGFREPALPTAVPSPSFLAPPTPTSLPVAATPPPEQLFDAFGYLMAVKQAPQGVPPYHLVDTDGITRHYVTPLPGLNLERYVGKQVGIKGKRGYSETLRKPHVVAERVVLPQRR